MRRAYVLLTGVGDYFGMRFLLPALFTAAKLAVRPSSRPNTSSTSRRATWVETTRSAGDMRCAVLLADSEQQRLRFVAAPNIPEDYKRGIEPYLRIAPDMGSCGTAAFLRQPDQLQEDL